MSLAASILSAEARASLLDTIAQKAREACFVDWVVGTIFAALYLPPVLNGFNVAQIDAAALWPLVGLVAFTRTGDAIKAFAGKGRRAAHG